ncbi:MAG: TRCF domain-containing protein, partial [Eubacteriales bacterium]
TEAQLSQVMEDMNSGDIQILVCTTIIETGIDISNVNTLIIENADRFGLSQLHQLRGRVGRSNRHAFCYLTYKKGKVLTEVADKRLSAIRDFAEFGSGFKIAMRDLEIRGAGDLLGAEQSGHLMSVGYDMYLKLLEEAVVEERGDVRPVEPSCSADLVVSANIPKEFVASGEQRMDLYRRMAAIRTQEDGDELLDEIVDRFGDLPKSVMNLISVALLRAQAAQTGIVEIAQKQSEILFTMDNLNFGALSALGMEEEFGKRILFVSGTKPAIRYKMLKGENPLKVAQRIVERYEFLVNTADK